MALPKQSIPFNFLKGLDLKTDPKQVTIGNFLALSNTIFQTGGLMQKRNGYGLLTDLPDESNTYLTTFNGDLTALGTSLQAYVPGNEAWVNKGAIQPVNLSVSTIVRNNTNQIWADSAISANNLVCTVYTDSVPVSGTPVDFYRYVITDYATGQNVVAPITITAANTAYGTPRVFLLGNYFIIIFTGGTTGAYTLKFIAISSLNPSVATAPANISTNYAPAVQLAFDAIPFSNQLYIAWNNSASSGINMATLSLSLTVSAVVNPDASHGATTVSVNADTMNSVIWVSYYNSNTTNGYAFSVNNLLATTTAPTQVITGQVVQNITSISNAGVNNIVYEVYNLYTYEGVETAYLEQVAITQAAVVGTPAVLKRSLGLGSKAFTIDGTNYVLGAYQSAYQPSYFLLDLSGNIVAKLAYGNGRGNLPTGIPTATVIGTTANIPYLYKDLITAVNKNTNVPQGNQTAGIYSQTGINLAEFNITTSDIVSAEIGTNLNITGGFLWGYDGYSPVESNFNIWPEDIVGAWSDGGGAMAAQPDGMTNANAYFYQVTYEWTDNQGNAFRSAPSIPISITTTGTGTTGSVVLQGPMLRLTYKTANPVKIVIYRWSVEQEVYYEVTSIVNPLLNDPTVDSWTFTDILVDSAILGNAIIYTNGGVVENIGPPATNVVTLFDDRLWLVDAEDTNLLWYSKQVIEATPVEMSDLFTVYVAPTISASFGTGGIKAIAPLDDKLIIFKQDAIYYMNGSGPDNTGANSQYSQPIFITSTVGCSNQHSIVFMPQGLMFQSDKGIWLLGRDLSTNYIGAPVEKFNSYTVQSSVNVPATNQVRFTLAGGPTLMYDYYYGQWGTFTGISPIASTIYQSLHTFIDEYGRAFQETPGIYLDGSNPVLMSFQTGWLNMAGLQGLERAYYFYLIGEYLSPHRLNIQIAYDYAPAPSQQAIISPDNFNPAWGGLPLWGSNSPYGGNPSLEQWRIFLQQQKVQSFQIYLTEIYDPSYGIPAGAGFTLSGVNVVAGIKKQYPTLRPARSTG